MLLKYKFAGQSQTCAFEEMAESLDLHVYEYQTREERKRKKSEEELKAARRKAKLLLIFLTALTWS